MQVQVSTDNHVQGNEELARQVEAVVDGTLGRFGDRITRVAVHLTDESSSQKSGDDDKRCDLAELVLRMKGKVVVVPAGRMPSDTGAAATYRF